MQYQQSVNSRLLFVSFVSIRPSLNPTNPTVTEKEAAKSSTAGAGTNASYCSSSLAQGKQTQKGLHTAGLSRRVHQGDKIDALVDFLIQGLDLSGKILKVDDNVYDILDVSNQLAVPEAVILSIFLIYKYNCICLVSFTVIDINYSY